MAAIQVALSALVLSGLVLSSEAGDFLSAREGSYIQKEEVERTLLDELSGVSSSERIRGLEEELRPMFSALPKNSQGGLEPTIVRYALHRFFVLQHGWYMSGLDPAGGAWNNSIGMPSTIMKDRAPAYILSLFEQRQRSQGLGLHELAVFAAVLSDLVYKEASFALQKVYSELELPTVGPVAQSLSNEAVKAYFIQVLMGGNINYTSLANVRFMEGELLKQYPYWDETSMWVDDFRRSYGLMVESRRNPFNGPEDSFDDSVELVKELKHNFGAFQDYECKALKSKLVDMEHQGSGRVRLSRFYGGALGGDWTLGESVEYLRNLGALDETNPKMPSLVIANYINSPTNCLVASGFYSVCCFDECFGLMRDVESMIAAPSGTPSRIAHVVSGIHSDTVVAPRNLSSALHARLDDIAKLHGGYVPLHGRLFAQWMHHAYPRECPFPHVSGTTNPLLPEEFMASSGFETIDATVEEMEWHHSRWEEESSESDDLVLPWQDVEELMATVAESPNRRAQARGLLHIVMALGALVAIAVPIKSALRVAISGSDVSDKQILV